MCGKLTESIIKGLQPAEPGKTYKRADGDGLYIQVFDDGKKRWRWQYQYGGKRCVLGLGVWPKVSLRDARAARDEARRQVEQGINPVALRRQARNGEAADGGQTFAAIALKWRKHQAATWSEGHANIVAQRTELYLLPELGKRNIAEITPADMLALVRGIEEKGARDTARRVTAIASQIFKHAILMGQANINPADAIKAALAPAAGAKPMRYTVEPEALGAFLTACERYSGNAATRAALALAPYLFLRPGELRQLTWEQVDLERAELRLPVEAMKRRRTIKEARKGEVAHIVPLSRQARELFAAWREEQGRGGKGYVFTARQGQPISNATMSRALDRLGEAAQGQTIHGLRHTASTILHEQGFDTRIIEKQLAHTDQNRVRGIYNHAEYLTERRKMMEAWADWLDATKATARAEQDGKTKKGVHLADTPCDEEAKATTATAERNAARQGQTATAAEDEDQDFLDMMMRQTAIGD